MNKEIFKYVPTPHLATLGECIPRDDKLTTPDKVFQLLSSRIIVDEKLDGANAGISVGSISELCAQNRRNYIPRDATG